MSHHRRIHVPGGWYLITLPAHAKREFFIEQRDYEIFGWMLADALAHCSAQVHAFCFRPTEINLLIRIADISVSELIRDLAAEYARWFKETHRHSGRLFRQEHRQLLIDPKDYLLEAIRYLHWLPVLEKLVADLEEWPWTSHRAYLGEVYVPWLSTDVVLRATKFHDQHPRQPIPAEMLIDKTGAAEAIEAVVHTAHLALEQRADEFASLTEPERSSLLRAIACAYSMGMAVATLPQLARYFNHMPMRLWQEIEHDTRTWPDLFRPIPKSDASALPAPHESSH